MSSTEGAGPPGLPGPGDGGGGGGGPAWGAPPGTVAPGPPGGSQPPPGYPYRPAIPPPDLAGGVQSGNRARVALWVGFAAYAVQSVCSMIVFAAFSEVFSQMLDDIDRGRTRTSYPAMNEPQVVVANLASNVASLALLIVAIVFLVWFHKAASNARSLGVPAAHSPGWAVGGFFVPIINLWFPYQSMRDLFPPDHPGRSLAGRWWATWLGAGFVATAAFVTALFSPVVGWALAAVVVALYLWAAVTARQLIALSSEVHGELAAAHGWATPAPGYPPAGAPPGYPPAGYPPGTGTAPGYAPTGYPPTGGPGYPPGGAAEPQPPKDPWNRP